MKVDMKFEVAIVPVSDVDRAKAFYTKLGWRVDDDIVNGKDFRAVQLTPPGSAASVTFGTSYSHLNRYVSGWRHHWKPVFRVAPRTISVGMDVMHCGRITGKPSVIQ